MPPAHLTLPRSIMPKPIDRRQFLSATTAGGIAFGAAGSLTTQTRPAKAQTTAANVVTLAIMGVNGRGTGLAEGFTQQKGARIAYVCDPDERAIGKAKAAIAQRQKENVVGLADFRKALDDPAVDALVIAAPNHWHAPATILACAAGKHVYVEKPCCHNPHEGELMIAAARKHNRVVQHGTQRRSWPALKEGIERLRAGDLGRVLVAKAWYNNKRPSIGHGQTANVPAWLNYSLWQGPAPERPYRDNLIHYNWHWFWHWGNGELGNNGVHGIDVCRWGLGVEYPKRVTSAGNKLRWDDDQETPDTHTVTFDFGDRSIIWEGRSWSLQWSSKETFGIEFYGERGSLVSENGGYVMYDPDNKEIARKNGRGGEADHLADFLQGIRESKRPNAEIAEGYKSTLLCHLGNISHRVGRVLEVDPANGHIKQDSEADQLWRREYRNGWEPVA
jgi:predicted dehydrogenase